MWSLENPAIKNGILAGIASAVFVLLLYLVNPRWIFGFPSYITTIIIIVMMVQSVKAEKKLLEYAAFSDVLKPAFLTFVIANLIYVIFYYILVNFIAPELLDVQKEITIEMIGKMSGLMGEEGTEAALEQLEARNFDFGLKTAAWTYAFGLIFPGFIIAAIIAAVMKDRRPVES